MQLGVPIDGQNVCSILGSFKLCKTPAQEMWEEVM